MATRSSPRSASPPGPGQPGAGVFVLGVWAVLFASALAFVVE